MINLLTKNNSFCLLIDVQEKLFPAIEANVQLEKDLLFLLEGLKILDISLLITEQYPKGLGKTISTLTNQFVKPKILEKSEFSAWSNPNIKQEIINLDKKQVIIIGIESHVCILQTALQMLRHGFEVFIPQECIGSRTQANKQNALQRIQTAGGIITNSESCLFEILETSNHEKFKAISQLIKSK